MKRMSALLIVLLIVIFSACDRNSVQETNLNSSTDPTQYSLDTSKYIIQTPFYQIYEDDLHSYHYRIGSGKDILVEDIKIGTAPQIEDKMDGIVKLHLGFGTNAFTVQYFDVYNRTASEEFHPYTNYADYIDTDTKEYYIAYFKPEENPKLYIDGFFESSDFSRELDLDFSMPTCEKIIFLNDTQIYIEYIDNNSEKVKEVVDFKSAINTN